MRTLRILAKGLVAVVIMASFSQSCTNLDEELYDEVLPDEFFQTEEEIISAMGAAYTKFQNLASGDPINLQCITTDEMVVPTRGQDWDDGGAWRRLHLHSWTSEDGVFNGVWNFGFDGVNTANRLIYQFQYLVEQGQMESATANAFIAELRVIRGYFYWQLIDVFGNVPLVTDFVNTEAAPPTVPRDAVFAWVVADLEEAVPLLTKTVDGTTYGRMNYYVGQALLAKLYLNAEVYTGTAMYDKTVTACNEIIDSDIYHLEGNYFANFDADITGSSEFIFAIPYDRVYFGGFNLTARTLHYGSQHTYNLTAQPWNGFCSLEEFYNSYEDTDLRKGTPGTIDGPSTVRGNFLAGYQFKSDLTPVVDDGAKNDPDGPHLNFGSIGSGEPQINELGPQAYRQAGVRIGKWEFEMGGDPGAMSNDYAVFRLADILLMKAEALWRQNPGHADILPTINEIRARAGVADLTTVDGPFSFDMDGGDVDGGELYNEMGREMFAEQTKRQAMIRWGVFTDLEKWILPYNNTGDMHETGDHTVLFPIHRDKIEANPNLDQNTGYN